MDHKNITPDNKLFNDLQSSYGTISDAVDLIRDMDNDSSHGVFISSAFDSVEPKDGGGNKLSATLQCRIWGNPLNIEQMLFSMAQQNQQFADVLFKTGKRLAAVRMRAIAEKKGIIILPNKSLLLPKK